VLPGEAGAFLHGGAAALFAGLMIEALKRLGSFRGGRARLINLVAFGLTLLLEAVAGLAVYQATGRYPLFAVARAALVGAAPATLGLLGRQEREDDGRGAMGEGACKGTAPPCPYPDARPVYHVVDRRLWAGTRHTELYATLRHLAEVWGAERVVVDATSLARAWRPFWRPRWASAWCASCLAPEAKAPGLGLPGAGRGRALPGLRR